MSSTGSELTLTGAAVAARRHSNKVLIVSFLAWTLTNMDQAFFGYAIPGILRDLELPLSMMGLIMTVSFLFASLLLVATGHLADRYGRAPMLATFLALSAFFVGLQGLAGGIVLLTLLRALGFGLSGVLSPITNAYVVENVQPRWRGLAMGVLQCGYPMGWFLASAIAVPLLTVYDWRAMFFAAFLVIPIAGCFYWLLRNEPDVRPQPQGNAEPGLSLKAMLWGEFRRPALASIGLHFAFGGAYAGSAFFFPTFFATTRGYSEAEAASLVGLSNGIAVGGYLFAAYAGEFLLTRRTVFMAWTATGIASLLALTWLPQTRAEDTLWYAITAATLYGSMAVLPVLIAEIFPEHSRSRGLAVCASAPLALGFAIFPLVVPFVVDAAGWEWTFSLLICPLLLLALLCSAFLPNRRSGLPMV